LYLFFAFVSFEKLILIIVISKIYLIRVDKELWVQNNY